MTDSTPESGQDLLRVTIREASNSFRSASDSPVSLTRAVLARIDELNSSLNCFITVLHESALDVARKSESRFRSGAALGPLDGIPIAVKDLIYIEGVKCTAGSEILRNHVASYDAPVVRRLKAAGAVIVGTANLHEFAAGVTSDNPHYGAVRNPWDETKVAGGSSGGSAAAVAAGLALGALGTDTGGSVRIPAALCGVVGLKPTYGRVSRLGVVPLSSSLDTVGCITRGVWDAAAVLNVIAGGEKGDMTTVESEVPDYTKALDRPFNGAKIGIPSKYFHEALDPDVEASFQGFVSQLEQAGCEVRKMEVDGIDQAVSDWFPIRRAEATAFHRKWLDSTPELYGDDVRKLLELGRDVSAVDYVTAINTRPMIMEKFSSSMEGLDALAVPATCVPATSIGQRTVKLSGRDVEVYLPLIRLTLPFNLVGFPAICLPADPVHGLPVGAQLIGRPFDEARILEVAHAYEAKYGPFPVPTLGSA